MKGVTVMKKGKKIVALTLSGMLLFMNTQGPVYADFKNTVYEEKSEEYIAKGVKHEKLLKFTDTGWLNIHITRVDLTDEDVSLDLLSHEDGVRKKGKLTELAKQGENIVSAINGDFFNMKSAATTGPMVEDGELLATTFHKTEEVPTFNLSKGGNPFISRWTNSNIVIKNEATQFDFHLSSVNKESYRDNTAILYTKKWGEMSLAPNHQLENVMSMVVEDGIVVDMSSTSREHYIPKNGYVVSATGEKALELGVNFVIGDQVDFIVDTNLEIKDLDLSIGGGAILVENGEVKSEYHLNIRGNQPRTAVGISKDKKELMLLTIDGRTSSYTGVTQRELGEIMLSLGANDAINLDGGGSTDMVLRPLGEEDIKVVNHLSGGYERSIMNGIGVVTTASKESRLGGIKLHMKETNMVVNTSKSIELKGYDKNYNPVDVDYDEVKWTVTGVKGNFYKNTFQPVTGGEGAILAEYKGVYDTIPIRVIDGSGQLRIYPSKIDAEKNKKTFMKAVVVDKDGYRATVNFSDLHIDVPKNLGNVDDKGYFVAANGASSGYIKASYGELETHIPVIIGSKEVIVDEFENINGTFLSYPQEVTGGYNTSSFSKEGNFSGEISYDFTKTDTTRAAYLVFDNGGINFSKVPKKIGLWVYGNQSGHALKAKISSVDGNPQSITLANRIDWDGWKYVGATIPSNIEAPFKLERIYVVEPTTVGKDIGKIYVDQLTAYYSNELEERLSDIEKNMDGRNVKGELKGNRSFKFFIGDGMGQVDEEILDQSSILMKQGYFSTEHKDSLFIRLDNSKGSLRKTNFEQWRFLLDTAKYVKQDNVFVILPKPLYFSDKLEKKLFEDTLRKLKEEENKEVWIITGGHKEFKGYAEDGLRYINLKLYDQGSKEKQKDFVVFTVNEDEVTYEVLSTSK